MTQAVIVVIDEGIDLRLKVAREEVVLQEDTVLQGLVSALDLALGLQMLGALSPETMVWKLAAQVHLAYRAGARCRRRSSDCVGALLGSRRARLLGEPGRRRPNARTSPHYGELDRGRRARPSRENSAQIQRVDLLRLHRRPCRRRSRFRRRAKVNHRRRLDRTDAPLQLRRRPIPPASLLRRDKNHERADFGILQRHRSPGTVGAGQHVRARCLPVDSGGKRIEWREMARIAGSPGLALIYELAIPKRVGRADTLAGIDLVRKLGNEMSVLRAAYGLPQIWRIG